MLIPDWINTNSTDKEECYLITDHTALDYLRKCPEAIFLIDSTIDPYQEQYGIYNKLNTV